MLLLLLLQEKAFTDVNQLIGRAQASGAGGALPPSVQKAKERCKGFEAFAKWATVRGHTAPTCVIEPGVDMGTNTKAQTKRKALR